MVRLNLLGGKINLLGGQMPTQLPAIYRPVTLSRLEFRDSRVSRFVGEMILWMTG